MKDLLFVVLEERGRKMPFCLRLKSLEDEEFFLKIKSLLGSLSLENSLKEEGITYMH